MNEIVDLQRRLEDSDKEEELFNAFVGARNGYLEAITSGIRGDELEKLYLAERETFTNYYQHRTKIKP